MNATNTETLRADFDVPLRAAVISAQSHAPKEAHLAAVRQVLSGRDTVEIVSHDALGSDETFDLAFVVHALGATPASAALAAAGVPAMCLEPFCGYHAYHAGFYRELEAAGGTPLPGDLPETIAAAVQAVRARRALRGMKLIVADPGDDEHRNARLRHFADCAAERMGIEVVVRSTDEIKERARGVADAAAEAELHRWYAEVLTGPGEMDADHMRQVVRLYLAEKAMLDETGAVGITPHDIMGFLTIPKPEVMPNVSYGPLLFDGFLVCEEADIEALTTELLLAAGLGRRGMMSNIYYAYRDRFAALESARDYTPELELADCRQCFEDNHVTISHFSTAGVLPPAMMQESRYEVREALPCWPGQSMIAATPKLGPVLVARLDVNAEAVHLVHGEADGTGFGDQYGWHRGRWFVRLPDARDFAARALHHHYIIVPAADDHGRLATLCKLLGIQER